MSEQLRAPTETFEAIATAEQPASRERAASGEAATASPERLTRLHSRVEQHARSAAEVVIHKPAVADQLSHHASYQQLKNTSYQRSLERIQARLPGPARLFSRISHQPLVDSLSQAVGSTVGRPAGLLGGSLFALVGSGGLLLMGRQYGFAYNYLAWFVLMAAGFIAGLVGEAIIGRLRR